LIHMNRPNTLDTACPNSLDLGGAAMHSDIQSPDPKVRLNKLGRPRPTEFLFEDYLIPSGPDSINLLACREREEATAFSIQMVAALSEGKEFLGYKCNPTSSAYITWDYENAARAKANGIPTLLLPQNCRSVAELLQQIPTDVRFAV